MTLDTLDWATITQAQAAKLIGAARKFARDEITMAEHWKAIEVEENLRVYALTGIKPC